MSDIGAIVIGAGPSGLATAACLKQSGIEALILEKTDSVGSAWRNHYERLHLHTDRAHSGLPGMAMPHNLPHYPARADVVAYLESYADHFGLRPRFNTIAKHAARANGGWSVETDAGTESAPSLVVATGIANWPARPRWPGEEKFSGEILHSHDYRNAAPYAGKRVLVVGFGNSGGEIALDLAENGVSVALAVRGPVNIVPRDLLGIPILSWAMAMRSLPTPVADALSAPLIRMSIGSMAPLGLTRPLEGPLTGIRDKGRVPLLDIGTVAAIRRGAIEVRPGLKSFDTSIVEFADGRREQFDAVILATGFAPDLRSLLPGAEGVLDASGAPKVSGARTAAPGLYFCGFLVAPGQLRRIGVEARAIAADISGRR